MKLTKTNRQMNMQSASTQHFDQLQQRRQELANIGCIECYAFEFYVQKATTTTKTEEKIIEVSKVRVDCTFLIFSERRLKRRETNCCVNGALKLLNDCCFYSFRFVLMFNRLFTTSEISSN